MNRFLISAKVVELIRRQHLLHEAAETTSKYPEGRFHGRGIVICGGGDVYFPCAWVTIRMLRQLGCRLPIELWYRGRREMNARMIELMRGLDVTCVDAYRIARTHPTRRLDSWELKCFALVNCSFEEVLFLDADNVPAADPTFLFHSPEYVEHGAIFWPDRWPGSGREWLRREAWFLCGVPYRLEPEIESGQMLIDKRRCWRPLQIALYINEHSDFFYEYFYGDKDTFHLAWRRANLPYALAPHPPRTLGESDVIEQYDFQGDILFQHRNGDKWSITRQNRCIAGFLRERECFQFLDELKGKWGAPLCSFPADFDRRERRVWSELAAVRWFDFEIEGRDGFAIELRPDFTAGDGAGELQLVWMVETDKDGSVLLSLRGAGAPTCFLRLGEDGVWSGRWLIHERMKVHLRASAVPCRVPCG